MAALKAAKPAHPNSAACGPLRAAKMAPDTQPADTEFTMSCLARYYK